jgi:alpha-L-fucosidase
MKTKITILFLLGYLIISSMNLKAQQRASWMKGKWGVMIHYQAGWLAQENKLDSITLDKWNDLVDNFDCEGLAQQLSDAGAKYLIITITHAAPYFCAPNLMYDHYTGLIPSRCSKRDLVADLSVALSKHGIKTIAYIGGPPPHRNQSEIKGFALDRNDNRQSEGLLRWQEVIREYSIRWGEKVSGWWMDGCYSANIMYRQPDAPNFATMAAAARAGNPMSIVAFNTGVYPRIHSVTPYEDYTAGEINAPDSVVIKYNNNGIMDGSQLQILTFLGKFWGQGNPRFTDDQVIKCSQNIIKSSGAITWDCPVLPSGLISEPFLKQLKSLGKALDVK